MKINDITITRSREQKIISKGCITAMHTNIFIMLKLFSG